MIALLSVPGLSVGWLHDDFIHRQMLSGSYAELRRDSDELYCFSGGPRSRQPSQFEPWWRSPQQTTCFFRPLSSLSAALDHRLFAEHPMLAHLHGLLWFFSLCAAVYFLARKLFSPATATLALLLYGVSGYSATPIAWVASRHTIVSAALSVFGLVAYVHGRKTGQTSAILGGYALLAAALLGGEGALGGLGYVVAYELFVARDTFRLRHGSVSVLIAAAYVGFYVRSGYGAAHSGAYLDPLHHPKDFLLALPGRLLCLTGEAVFGIPSVLWSLTDQHLLLAAIGLVGVALFAMALRLGTPASDTVRRSTLAFLLCGALLGAIPAAAAVMGGRVLMLPGVGLAISFAAVLLPETEGVSSLSGRKRTMARSFSAALALGLLLANPLARLAQLRLLAQLARSEQTLRAVGQLQGCEAAQEYLFIGTNEFTTGLYGPYLLPVLAAPKRWHQLTLASSDVQVERLDARTLRLTATDHRPLLGGLLYALYRSPHEGLGPGSVLPLDEQHAESGIVHIEQAGSQGPTALRFELPVDLDDRRYCWLRYDGKQLLSVKLPAILGRSVIPYSAGPLAF